MLHDTAPAQIVQQCGTGEALDLSCTAQQTLQEGLADYQQKEPQHTLNEPRGDDSCERHSPAWAAPKPAATLSEGGSIIRGWTRADKCDAARKDWELGGPNSQAAGSMANTEGAGNACGTTGGSGIETKGTTGTKTSATVTVGLASSSAPNSSPGLLDDLNLESKTRMCIIPIKILLADLVLLTQHTEPGQELVIWLPKDLVAPPWLDTQ